METIPTDWPPHPLAGTKPVLRNFLTPILMSLFLEDSIFHDECESHLALCLLALSSPPNSLVLVLKSTPNV